MRRDRIIQFVAALVCIVSTALAGAQLPPMLEQAERHALRYTNESVEGAPPIVALGTAIGALRGVIVDYLWIKIHMMQMEGLYYEAMADAELITRLQPRFAQVWAFHGHNLAYNISVQTHTVEERWEWVKAGVRLVRNEGLRYNPNNLTLHKELAYWFAHKIEGTSDDAHFYYKQELTREWHYLLGQPPDDYQQRIEWIKRIAEAPESIELADRRLDGVKELADRLRRQIGPYTEQQELNFDMRFLRLYGDWKAIREESAYAQASNLEQQLREDRPSFIAFDEIASDPEVQQQWDVLIRTVRKKLLREQYNMDPQLMYEYTRDLGPIDWRHGQAHALYWARKGSQMAEGRNLTTEDKYIVVNNDRLQLQAMQGLARYGRITFDPLSNRQPGRFPEPRWVDTIPEQFDHFYVKHYETRGWGGDTFIAFLENFMSQMVAFWYRAGELDRAREILDLLDQRFGSGAIRGNPNYSMPLDVFVKQTTFNEYQYQPYLAVQHVTASLRYGFRVGLGENRPDVLVNAIQFANAITQHFRNAENTDFTTKFGTGRLKDLIGQLDSSTEQVLLQVMIDSGLGLEERARIWQQIDRAAAQRRELRPLVQLRPRIYDRMMSQLRQQFQNSYLSQTTQLKTLFPEPPGLEAYRQRVAEQEQAPEQNEQDPGISRQ